MPNEDQPAPLTASRRLIAAGIGAGLLLSALVVTVIFTREERTGEVSSTVLPSSSGTTVTSIGLNTRTVVVERLKSILRLRDRAFQDRNSKILEDIYTVDCPCLEGDRNAIKELESNDYRVIGGSTSIQVRRVEKVDDRLWLIIADFKSAPLRIETKNRELIREEPAGDDLFQFALSKPRGSIEWLLGRATAYREGSG